MAISRSIVVLLAGLAACATLLQGCGGDALVKPSDKCCTAIEAGLDYAADHKTVDKDPAKAQKVVTETTALEKATTKACADEKEKDKKKWDVLACKAATCEIKAGFQCAGISAGCCKANQDMATFAAGSAKKIEDAGADATKIKAIGDEGKALGEKVGTECKEDKSAMEKCKQPKTESTCEIKAGFQCAGISAGCCKANQDMATYAAGSAKKIADAGADATKIKAIGDEGTVVNKKVETECKEDKTAMEKCKAPKTAMVAEEPQQMLAGFCGFLAGAAVMGLATGLKRWQSPQQPQLLG